MAALQQHRVVSLWVAHLFRNWANKNVVERKAGPKIDLTWHFFGIEISDTSLHGPLRKDVLRQAIRRGHHRHKKGVLLVDPMDLAVKIIYLGDYGLPKFVQTRLAE